MMSIRNIKQLPLPKYSKGEEIFNLISHLVGVGIGLFIIIYSSIYAVANDLKALDLISMLIFGFTSLTLYAVSSLYHGLSPDLFSKKIFRVIDHCTIYLLIAGTYTPIIIMGLKESPYFLLLILIQWGGALVGIILNALDMSGKVTTIVSLALYVVMGWSIIFIPGAISLIPCVAFGLILAGGISYTIGVIFYSLGSKKKWFHSIFHIFCDVGTIIQMFGIIYIFINH